MKLARDLIIQSCSAGFDTATMISHGRTSLDECTCLLQSSKLFKKNTMNSVFRSRIQELLWNTTNSGNIFSQLFRTS